MLLRNADWNLKVERQMLRSKMLTTRCTQGTLKLFKKKLLWKNVSVSATLDQVAQVYDIYRRYCEERSDSRIGCGGLPS